MSDHLWMIPVSGGGTFGPVPATWAPMVPPWEFNVQWGFTYYPTGEPLTAQPCISANPSVLITRSNSADEQNKLNNCYGRWTWRSCTDGQNITVGGQLGVGTVFSRVMRLANGPGFPPLTYDYWNYVEVWAKYRISTVVRLSAIHLVVNDIAGVVIAASGNDILSPVNNIWHTIHATNPAALGPPRHEDENLRATLTFLGTVLPANVGEVNVDVEWFAFRLRDQVTV